MTIVTGTIKDSAGVALDGTLTFTVPSPRPYETNILLPVPHEFSIVAGVVNIDIPPGPYVVNFQDTLGTTYWEVVTTLGEDPTTIDMLPGLILEDRYNLALNLVAKVLVEQYIDRLKAGFVYKGVYDPGTTYELNQWVNYFGSSYLHIGVEPTTGVDPLVFPIWALIASKGDEGPPGVGTTGSLDPFGASWVGSNIATAQGAVYDQLITRSPVNNPTFTGTVNAPTPIDPGDNTSLVATCEWVNNYRSNLPQVSSVTPSELVVSDPSSTLKIYWGEYTTPVINWTRAVEEVFTVNIPGSMPNKLMVTGSIKTLSADGLYHFLADTGLTDTTIRLGVTLGRPASTTESLTLTWLLIGY